MAEDDRANKSLDTRPMREVLGGLFEMLDQAFRQSEDCTTVLQRHLPDWDGKLDSFADLEHLGKSLEKAYPNEKGGADVRKMPDEVVRAMVNLFITRVRGDLVGEITDKFGNLDPLQSFTKLWGVFTSAVDAKRKGGQATAQWTAEVDKKAREIFAELKRSNMKDTPAYGRTAIKLRDHGHEFSASTVRRHLKDSNAKR